MTVVPSTGMLVASKATFLENYLAVSAWIFNGSLIECHEKKHKPFSLSGIQFLGENLLGTGALENELSTRLLLKTCSKSHQAPDVL